MRRSATAIICCAILTSCAQEKTPQITVVGENTYNFGKYAARLQKSAEYKIKNSGSDTLKIINVHNACACARATCEKSSLAPGEETNIKVTVFPNSIYKKFTLATYVKSNDPKTPFLALSTKGYAIPLVDISPIDFLYAGRLNTNTSWSQEFTFKATEPDVKLGNPTFENNLPIHSYYEAREEEPYNAKLKITMKPSPESGDFKCSVNIPVLSPKNHPPIRMGVSARIGTELAVIPGTILMQPTDEQETYVCYLRLIGQHARKLKPEEIILPKDKRVSFKVAQGSNQKDLEVTAVFNAGFTDDLYAAEVIPLTFSAPNAASATLNCRIRR